MHPTKKRLRKLVTRYGVAISALSLSPCADAAIVDLTPNLPGPFPFGPVTNSVAFDFVGGSAADLVQYNDPNGKTFAARGSIWGCATLPSARPLRSARALLSAFL